MKEYNIYSSESEISYDLMKLTTYTENQICLLKVDKMANSIKTISVLNY